MKSLPCVTVVVCSYNRATLLPQVVTELLRQDFPKNQLEILVVDNASTDQTAQVAAQLVHDGGGRVRYVLEKRPGVTFARNRGAEEGALSIHRLL